MKRVYVLCFAIGASIGLTFSTLAKLSRAQDQLEETRSQLSELQQSYVELSDRVDSMKIQYLPSEFADQRSDVEEEAQEQSENQTTEMFTITAYCPCTSCCGIWSEDHPSRQGTDYVQKTSSGTIPAEGRTIATDPNVIPSGTHVIIGGQEYIAEDTGGAIKGNRIDVFFDSHQEALEWGVKEMEVTILEN